MASFFHHLSAATHADALFMVRRVLFAALYPRAAPIAASSTPQRFIPYGALWGAPLEDDGLVVSRKDFTYAEATTGAPFAGATTGSTGVTTIQRMGRTERFGPVAVAVGFH